MKCENCKHDVSGIAERSELHGEVRCPECGHEIDVVIVVDLDKQSDVDDSWKIPENITINKD